MPPEELSGERRHTSAAYISGAIASGTPFAGISPEDIDSICDACQRAASQPSPALESGPEAQEVGEDGQTQEEMMPGTMENVGARIIKLTADRRRLRKQLQAFEEKMRKQGRLSGIDSGHRRRILGQISKLKQEIGLLQRKVNPNLPIEPSYEDGT